MHELTSVAALALELVVSVTGGVVIELEQVSEVLCAEAVHFLLVINYALQSFFAQLTLEDLLFYSASL